MPQRQRRGFVASSVLAVCALGLVLPACAADTESPSEDTRLSAIEGEFKRVVVSDPERNSSRFDYFLALDDSNWLKLRFAEGLDRDTLLDVEPNRLVRVTGRRAADIIDVTSIDPMSTETDIGTDRQALIAASPKRLAVILHNFANNTTQPIDVAAARQLIFTGSSTSNTSANAYFAEISYGVRTLVGKNQVDGDVYGWYTVDQSNTTCDYSTWGSNARSKAQAAGVDLTGYDHILHYFPRASSCSFSGVAQMPGRYSWINQSTASTISHELGHNFGVHHAGSLSCIANNVRVSFGGSCTLSEYGDPFDVMGRGYRHVNAFHKERLGFLEPGNVQLVTASGTFDVAPLEQKATGIQALRIDVAGTSDAYYVEYRQRFGFDSFATTDPVVNGVLVHRVTRGTRPLPTQLIDAVPSTTSFTDASLTVGNTFSDTAAGIAIKLNARSTASATVQVTLGGAPPPPPPTTTCATGEVESAGHCYVLTPSAQSYSAATTSCTSRGTGWHVVTIGDATENAFVSSLTGTGEFWLGAGDASFEGNFVWVTGQTFWTGGLSGTPSAGAYTNFVSGEPNNSGDCLRIVAGGQWRDVSCSSSYRAVCEKG